MANAPTRGGGIRRLGGLGVVLAALALSGCASDDDPNEYEPGSVGELYNSAMNLMDEERYKKAAKTFDEVERQHPYSVWASKAQLMSAYAHYLNNSYTEAINALDRFIELHPGNRDIAYAYYLKALSYYERIRDVRRDQSMTSQARDALQQVIRRFPDSKYARDAELKMDLVEDHLAGKEMTVGRYYLNKGHYLAAINRFRAVVKDYQTTSHVPEALHRLTEAYLALGMKDEAQKTASVLGHNFPTSEWYVDSYELLTGKDLAPERADDDSWIGKVWHSVI
ncbi:Beta-barrel assembly machine subunit BamD [Limimonas halophila]|uniref:Outer membrane protein assembly factor BamD n=2 Tax=Limimonas halophila TaxID=1082479 RepID=A0A1G7U520_9PROT|nr:Beta-barrel assembly machine subunit BamD [Limimonas halophila]